MPKKQANERIKILEQEISVLSSELRQALSEYGVMRALVMGQRRVLSKLALNDSLDEALKTLVFHIEQLIPHSLGAVLLLDNSGEFFRLGAAPHLPDEYTRAMNGSKVSPNVGPCGAAVIQKDRVIVSSIEKDPIWTEYKTMALSLGLKACWANPIFSTDYEVLGTVAVYYTEQKTPSDFELELIETTSHLAGIIIERKRSEDELLAAKEAAEQATRARGDFLANMSHEIRTPMNGLIGMTDLAIEIATTDEQKGYLELVKNCSQSLLTIINDILDFSKIEAGKLDFTVESFSLRDFINSTMAMLSFRADQKRLVFVSKVEAEVPSLLLGDVVRIGQILSNLLNNAIKFTHTDGAVFLYCAVSNKDQTHTTLHLAVTDTGIGIPQEKQSLIFDAFNQADTFMSRRYGGTGLGLSICKKLASLMGGKIWVRSKPDVGSAFHVTIRLAHPQELEIHPSTHVQEINAQHRLPLHTQPQASTARILLAEDNPVNAKLAAKLLERKGYNVVSVRDGKSVLEQLQKQPFDLILMDCQMPEMDGFEATAIIRSAEKNSGQHMPIIAMTANAMSGDRERCLSAGMDEYISKPIDKELLYRLIAKAIK